MNKLSYLILTITLLTGLTSCNTDKPVKQEKEEVKVKEQVEEKVKVKRKLVENPYSKFLEPNECIENLLSKKLTT